MRSFMGGLLNRMLLVMLGLSIVSMLVVAYWLLWPYDVIQHQLTPLPLEKTELRIGDVITYRAKYIKTMDAIGNAQVDLIDHVVIFYPAVIYAGSPGSYDIWGKSFAVPANTPPGRDYYLRFTVEYRVNPIRTVIERYQTEKFEVIE